MKNLLIILGILMAVVSVYAEETTSEKISVEVHDTKRAIKKNARRIQEKLCTEGDYKCVEEKAKHRASESKDYIKDKTEEFKNKLD